MYYELFLMHFHEFSFIGEYYFFSFKRTFISNRHNDLREYLANAKEYIKDCDIHAKV